MRTVGLGRNGAGWTASLWVVSIMVILIVTAASFFVDRLNGYAEDRVRAQAVLFSVEKDASQQAIAEYEAINEGEVTPEVVEGIAENRHELRVALDELELLDPRAQRVGRVRGSIGAHEAAIDEELRLIEAGHIKQAEVIDEERVDPNFEALQGILEDISAVYEADARRAALTADVSTYVTIFLAVVALAALFLIRQREQARRADQEADRRSQERFRSLVQNASDIVLIMGADQTVRYISPAVERILGYKPEDVVGKDNFTPVHPDDLDHVQHFIAEAVSNPGTTSASMQLRLQHADGSWRWMESRCTSLLEDPAVGGIVFNSRDITERRRAEEELRRSEARNRAILEAIPDLIFRVSRDGEYLDFPAKDDAELYVLRQEIVGKNLREVMPPELAEKALRLIAETLDTGEMRVLEYRLPVAEGTRYYEARLVVSGPGEVLCVVRDVTERKRAEEGLKEAEERYRTLVERIPAVTYVQEATGDNAVTYVSPQMRDLLGYEPEECTSDPYHWIGTLHPDDRVRVLAEDERTDRTGEPFSMEYRQIAKDGRVVWVRDEATLVCSKEGEPLYWLGVKSDVTERRRAEEARREAEAKYRTLVEQLPAITYVNTREQANDKLYVSPQIEPLLGVSVAEWTSDPRFWITLLHPEDRERVLAEVARSYETGEPLVTEYRMIARDGRPVWFRDEAKPVRDDTGRFYYHHGVMLDVTERKALERSLEHQAFHDELTGLPNRALFAERLGRSLARSDRQGKVAVLFVDIDDFKNVNDALGHWAGDRLLAEFAKRLKASVRPGDTVARFGGDEFVILLEGVVEERVATRVAEWTIAELRQEPFAVGVREIYVTPSIGIALSGYAERGWEDLLRRADLALHRAKEEGKARHACFTPDLDARLRTRLKLEGELRGALERGEFRVFYQPKASIASGEIEGMEALVRWEHPERGILSPSEFLALAEETGLIVPLGRWVLEEACHQANEWHQRHPQDPPLAMSVNLSAKQFRRQNLAEEVRAVLRESGLEPRGLTLEITEETAMEDAQAAIETLDKLKAMGVGIEVDDFGTGYSSLSYLKRFPVDYLKVDRTFVAGLGQNPEDEGIVRAVVELAHTLGLKVVAEGVESGEQLGLLREMGCELAQGSYFWSPLPAEAAGELLAAYNA